MPASYAADQLFATLDTTSRKLWIEGAGNIVISDTVGFIRDLPHSLVDAFHATLEAAQMPMCCCMSSTVRAMPVTRRSPKSTRSSPRSARAVRQILVWNKIDLTEAAPGVERDEYGNIARVRVSARTGEGLDLLRESLAEYARPKLKRRQEALVVWNPLTRCPTRLHKLIPNTHMIPTLGIFMSLNDPSGATVAGRWRQAQWQRSAPAQPGPPDLEELWRDFNRKLNRHVRQEGRRQRWRRRWPAHAADRFNPKFLGGGIGLLAALVAVVWLASGFYIVDASQRGLVLQFGKFKETTEPGLRWRLPYPIQSVEMVNLTGVRTVEVGYRGSERNKVLKEALMLTDDENIVNIQFAVQYVLKDPVEYLFNNRIPDDAVMGAAETAMREIVGKSKMDFVLYEGREQIATQAAKLMQDILDRYQDRHPDQPRSRCRTPSRPSRCRPPSTMRSRPARTASARRTKARPTPTT
jgi:hypothetical protein